MQMNRIIQTHSEKKDSQRTNSSRLAGTLKGANKENSLDMPFSFAPLISIRGVSASSNRMFGRWRESNLSAVKSPLRSCQVILALYAATSFKVQCQLSREKARLPQL